MIGTPRNMPSTPAMLPPDGNGYDDPERAETDGLSQDLWSEIETIRLL